MAESVQNAADERGRIFRSGSSEALPETLYEALIACVKAAGGSKQVGPLLWPEKAPDAAQRQLLDCLNDDRPQNLTPAQVLLVLRMARDRGCHVGIQYLAAALSYAEPQPIEPKDEADQLRREVVEGMRVLQATMQRLEQLDRPVARRVA